jgi:hypothetical protein
MRISELKEILLQARQEANEAKLNAHDVLKDAKRAYERALSVFELLLEATTEDIEED